MESEEPVKEEVYCFLNDSRVCGGDCIAFHGMPRENKELQDAQLPCVILQAAERTGRNLGILSGLVNQYVSSRKKQDADAIRNANLKPVEAK